VHLPRFQHIRPTSREQAARLLAEHGPAACPVSGGTDLFPRLKYGLARPQVVVSLRAVEPAEPTVREDGRFELDALMTLASVARSPQVRTRAPILAQAALCVASQQIRHMATLGGNLCLETRCLYYNQSHTFQFVDPCLKRGGGICYFAPKGGKCWAVLAADTVPALLALDAGLEIVGPAGRRECAVQDLYSGDAASPHTLAAGELVARVSIPTAGARRRSAFRKLSRRKGLEFAGLTVAVVAHLTEDSRVCTGARIAVGSVSGAPLRAEKAEAVLRGQKISDEELLREAARVAAAEIRPVAHHGYAAGYLRECLEVETVRALAEAVGASSSA